VRVMFDEFGEILGVCPSSSGSSFAPGEPANDNDAPTPSSAAPTPLFATPLPLIFSCARGSGREGKLGLRLGGA
jgi:hypothetical protein